MILVMIGMILCTAISISKIGATNSLKHVYPLVDALDERGCLVETPGAPTSSLHVQIRNFWCYTLNNKV
jgi:hypothetical protein